MSAASPTPATHARVLGTGSALPSRVLTNADLETMMDTSDEWIVQRTGIRERRIRAEGESTADLGAEALRRALDDAGVDAGELDMLLCATMTPDMPTPAVSCVVADRLGCGEIPALDLNAACSGFVYTMNVAAAMLATGQYRTLAVVGADTISRHMRYTTQGRNSAILFGDAGAAVVLRKEDAPSPRGLLAQTMHSNGDKARHLYIPMCHSDFYTPEDAGDDLVGMLHMDGKAVFKFAVAKFTEVIEHTLDAAALEPGDVQHYICHQANARILEYARDRFGLAPEQLPSNIDRFGNTVAASAPLLFDEQRRAGNIKDGERVMFLAFGAGMTWASSLWQL